MIKNPQLPDVDSSRGAPMGRLHWCENPRARCRVFRLRMVDGGYDQGGAYWGAPANIYACQSQAEDTVQLFTRATSRKAAKDHFLRLYPAMKFVN